MKVTLVSIVPHQVKEEKVHIHPSMYVLPPAKNGDFEILVIDDGIDHVYAGEGRHIDRIVPGERIAEDIINSNSNSQLNISADARPGLFYVDGVYNKAEIKVKFKDKLEEAKVKQTNWFKLIVRDADDIWQRFRQHRMISDNHREACDHLGIKREWNIKVDLSVNMLCPACGGQLPHPDVTICGTCRTIIKPEEHAKRFGLVGAK